MKTPPTDTPAISEETRALMERVHKLVEDGKLAQARNQVRFEQIAESLTRMRALAGLPPRQYSFARRRNQDGNETIAPPRSGQ